MVADVALGVVAAASAAPASPVWLVLGGLVLSSSLVVAVVGHIVASLRASAETRRAGYAEMSRVLISRVEFPYRIRRRTSDTPETLAELSRIGSDIQERLAAQRTWVAGESRAAAKVLDHVCGLLDADLRQAATDAWSHPPIAEPSEMVLGGWGPGAAARAPLELFRQATGFRFGVRRLVPGFVWRRWVMRGRSTRAN
jgi:hypothetical protein